MSKVQINPESTDLKNLSREGKIMNTAVLQTLSARITVAVAQLFADDTLSLEQIEKLLNEVPNNKRRTQKLKQFFYDLNRLNNGVNMHYKRDFNAELVERKPYAEAF